MSLETRFLEPLDVLFLRGNKLFGDPGSYGEALLPPWPSVAAGAIRSRMLADAGADLRNYATWPKELGTPTEPGSFCVTAFQLARRGDDGTVSALYPLPADLLVSEAADDKVNISPLTPHAASSGLQSSAPLPLLPVLSEAARSKPVSDRWLSEAGWRQYLQGQTPSATDLAKSSDLWQLDHRVGVGLDADQHRAADGRLFSVQAVAMIKRGNRIGTDKENDKPILADYNVGFLTAMTGAHPPTCGTLRLGGDGRAAALSVVDWVLPEADFAAIARSGRCRLVLTTPGLFAAGWLPTGITPHADGSYRFDLHGVKARLVSAAVPRAEVISGWDLAKWQPKAAQRAAPTGSVYWLDELHATPEALGKLAAEGLWSTPCEDATRRAEGFNRVALATWK